MRLASHLHMPVQLLQQYTSSSEFADWKQFLRDEWNNPSRSDHYLMQIAQEVRRLFRPNPIAIRLKHFLLRFKRDYDDDPEQEEESPIERSKRTWKQAFESIWNLQKRGKIKPPPPEANRRG